MPSRTQKFRGTRTHGRGRKAGRGSGKRGGTGNAGLGGHQKLQVIKNPDLFRRRGSNFRKGFRHETPVNRILNLRDLAQFEQSAVIDLTVLGYDKLLATGTVDRSMTIRTYACSERARTKIEQAGGTIEVQER